MDSLGERMRQARLAAGLTQTDVATEGVSRSLVAMIESGARQPGPDALVRIAGRLGVSPRWLQLGEAVSEVAAFRRMRECAKAHLVAGDPGAARDLLSSVNIAEVPASQRTDTAKLLAEALERCGDVDAAREVLEPLWREAIANRDALDALILTRGLLYLYLFEGRYDVTIDVGSRALDLFEQCESDLDPDELLRLESTLLAAQYENGNLTYATQQGVGLLKRAKSSGGKGGQLAVLWNLSDLNFRIGQYDRSQHYARLSVKMLDKGEGSRDRNFFCACGNYGNVLVNRPDPDAVRGLEQLVVARSGLEVLGGPVDLSEIDIYQSRAHLILGDINAAEYCAEAALYRGGCLRADDVVNALLALADAQVAGCRRQAGVELCRYAMDVLHDTGDARGAAILWRAIGDRLISAGESEIGCRALRRANSAAGIHGN